MLYLNQNITINKKKQLILLMIGDSKKYRYLAVTNLSGLLQGNSSNHRRDFYCLDCFNSYTTKNKLKKHEEICINHNSCCIVMPEQVNTTIKYNLVKTIQKNHLQKKKLDMSLLVGQCL